jgi:hypothetical protein
MPPDARLHEASRASRTMAAMRMGLDRCVINWAIEAQQRLCRSRNERKLLITIVAVGGNRAAGIPPIHQQQVTAAQTRFSGIKSPWIRHGKA